MNITSNVSFVRKTQKRYVGWRAKYSDRNPVNDPAVNPSFDAPPIRFSEGMQWLTWYFMSYINPLITKKNWASVFGGDTAFTNENGWDAPTDPYDYRRDYVQDRYDGYPEPKLMKAIICSGSFYRGNVSGGKLWMTPGVHAIDATKPLPDIKTIMENNWYFYATLNSRNPAYFEQGHGGKVVIPYFLIEETPYPLEWFDEWDSYELPDPLIRTIN